MGKLGLYAENSIVVGDCADIMANLPSDVINLIVTDPPYTRDTLYTYQYLADGCPRIMCHGASLVTLVGHYALPEVVRLFDGRLKYRWLLCMNQFDGPHARMAMGIEVMWKPVLWYVKGAYPQGRGFIRDGFVVTGTEGQRKERHRWEQDPSWAEYLIAKLSDEGDLVLDPFMGSGTTAVAADRLGRRFFGCDINPEYVKMANERIEADRQKRAQLEMDL